MTIPQESCSGTVNTVSSATLSSPNTHHLLTCHKKSPLPCGSLMPPVRAPNPLRKKETTSPDQFCPTTTSEVIDVVLLILKMKTYPHFLPTADPKKSLSDRRAFSSAIMCRPIKAHAFTVSAEMQDPNSTNSLRTIGSFFKKKKELSVRPILPWDTPMRGGCA